MPFKFTYLCDLLEKLEDLSTRDPPLLNRRRDALCRETIEQWFRRYRSRIDASDSCPVALLSALLPERRTDRVYGLRETGLVRLLGRVCGLGASRRRVLEQWREVGHGDLGACVELVQKQAEMSRVPAGREVTLEQIERALNAVAARCRFSNPQVRKSSGDPQDDLDLILRPIIDRLQSREAKWFARLILKSYLPVELPEQFVLRQFHFLLPDLLRFQSSFEAATALLRGPVMGSFPARPSSSAMDGLRDIARKELLPRIGVKVGRINFLKARSIKHCLQMIGKRSMSLERKYDGEYCQIHIDLSKGDDWLQIFSKSGKDSTKDRRAIQGTLRKCLRVGFTECRIMKRCILECEMLVFSDKSKSILSFHKLRKHLPRSGTYLGAAQDSPKYAHEHLMVVFFDILLLDDQALLTKNHNERMTTLDDLITQETGRAELAWRESIDFAHAGSATHLKTAFAKGIAARWEGFVLKPIDQPYFDIGDHQQSTSRSWIKLKKDYIKGLGDTADFAVVGAGFDAGSARELGLEDVRWTHFHLGCLVNKEDVVSFGDRPHFRVIEAIDRTISNSDRKTLVQLGLSQWEPYKPNDTHDIDVNMEDGLSCRMDAIFPKPFVIELMGGGFDRPSNKAYSTLRWPRVVKIHSDRSFMETVSFAELQEMAQDAARAPSDDASQEERDWVGRLERADPKTSRFAGRQIEEDESGTSEDEQVTPSKSSRSSNNRGPSHPPSLVRVDTDELLTMPTARVATAPPITSRLTRSLPTPPTSSPPENEDDTIIADRNGQLSRAFHEQLGKRRVQPPEDRSPPAPTPKRHKQDPTLNGSMSKGQSASRLSPLSVDKARSRRAPLSHTSITSSTESVPNSANAIPSLPLVEISNTRNFQRATGNGFRGHLGDNSGAAYPANNTTSGASTQTSRALLQRKAGVQPSTTTEPRPTDCIYTSPSLRRTPHRSQPNNNSTPPPPSTSAHQSSTCLLHNTIALLSPCVAQMPYLTSNLLPAHSIKIASFPLHLLSPTLDPSTRRVVLVETHRTQATAKILREVQMVKRDIATKDHIDPEEVFGGGSRRERGASEGRTLTLGGADASQDLSHVHAIAHTTEERGLGATSERVPVVLEQSHSHPDAPTTQIILPAPPNPLPIEVYDWRLLECIDRIERRRGRRQHQARASPSAYIENSVGDGGGSGHDDLEKENQQRIVGFDFWKRYFVCTL